MAHLAIKMKARQWALLAVLAATALVFAHKYLSSFSFPTKNAIKQELATLKEKQIALAVLRKKVANLDAKRAALRTQAAPFWQIQNKNVEQTVVAEFEKIARRAKVSTHRVDQPRKNKILDLNDVFEVDFSVQVTASMREITRLLDQIQQAKRRFYWAQCSIRPDNIRAPKNVRLIGRLKALVLTPEASQFLAGKGGTQT